MTMHAVFNNLLEKLHELLVLLNICTTIASLLSFLFYFFVCSLAFKCYAPIGIKVLLI